MSMSVLMVDHEVGKATYSFDALEELAKQLGAVSVYVDEEHDLYMLCKHPVTGEVEYHSVVELLDPKSTKASPQLTKV